MQATKVWARATAVVTLMSYLTLLLILPSCSSSKASAGPVGEVPTYTCDTSISGEVEPSAPIEGVSKIAYLLTRDGSITLDLLDDGANVIGTVQVLIDMELGTTFGARIEARYLEAGDVKAAQSTHVQKSGDGWRVRTRHEVGSAHALLWSQLDLDGRLVELALGAPLAAKSSEPVVVDDGVSYRSQPVVSAGGEPDIAGARQFIDQQGLDAINAAPSFQRLVQVTEDRAWADAARLQLRRCAASAADSAEGKLATSSSSLTSCSKSQAGAAASLSPAGADEALGQTQQAAGDACSTDTSPFSQVVQFESILGAVATGIVITGVLVVGWPAVFAAGSAELLATLVGSSIGAYVVGNWIQSLVDKASDQIPGLSDLKSIGRGDESGGAGATKSSGSSGDPHLLTFDGLYYDLQTAGEFVLAESTSGPDFTVQTRQQPAPGICPNVAYNTALATRLGNSTVHFDIDPARALMFDDQPATVPGNGILFENGDSLVHSSATRWVLNWAGGEQVSINGVGAGSHLDVFLDLPSSRKGQLRGLLGTYDGIHANELLTRSGTTLAQPVEFDTLLTEFAGSYRITQNESLFSYPAGGSTSDYDVADFPSGPTSSADLPPAIRASAEQDCLAANITNPIALEACIVDVGCTGDKTLVEAHQGVLPDAALAVSAPVDYSGWVVEGPGNWVVAPDGLSVLQTSNGNPTFFVTPTDYLNVQLTGSLSVESGGDDDIIGFVLGYQKPLTENGDDPNDLHAIVLSWKSVTQTSFGGIAQEGLTLSRSSGLQTDLTGTLWYHPLSPIYEVFATSYGAGLGWQPQTTYQFTISYTDSLIEIELDGQPLFSVTSAQAGGPFEAGRFGFYNFSQSNARYADFSVAPL